MEPLKLFVDDIRPAPDGWHQARTVTDAIRFLYKFGDRVTEVSLDHDISYLVEVAGSSRPFPSPETFMPVLYYIIARKIPVERLVIHTANVVAAEEMKAVALDGGYIPIINRANRVNRLELEV